jgi:predicted secreted protein
MTTEIQRLRVGEECQLRLESLLTAGYVWEPTIEGDRSVVDVSKQIAAERDQAVGSSPDEVFTIRAKRPGKATLRLTQRRPWEAQTAAANERVVELEVSP